MRHRQWLEQQGVDHTEDQRIGADATASSSTEVAANTGLFASRRRPKRRSRSNSDIDSKLLPHRQRHRPQHPARNRLHVLHILLLKTLAVAQVEKTVIGQRGPRQPVDPKFATTTRIVLLPARSNPVASTS